VTHARNRLRRCGDRGAAAVEFALVGCFVLVPLVLGLMQYGWYFYVASTTSHAASSVARRLEVGDCWTGTQATTYVQNQIPAPGTTDATLSKSPTSLTGATVGTTQIQVTVTAHAKIIGFLPMPAGGVVTRTVSAQLEDTSEDTPCS
jgi:Flp pilus assembly protein TadG